MLKITLELTLEQGETQSCERRVNNHAGVENTVTQTRGRYSHAEDHAQVNNHTEERMQSRGGREYSHAGVEKRHTMDPVTLTKERGVTVSSSRTQVKRENVFLDNNIEG